MNKHKIIFSFQRQKNSTSSQKRKYFLLHCFKVPCSPAVRIFIEPASSCAKTYLSILLPSHSYRRHFQALFLITHSTHTGRSERSAGNLLLLHPHNDDDPLDVLPPRQRNNSLRELIPGNCLPTPNVPDTRY